MMFLTATGFSSVSYYESLRGVYQSSGEMYTEDIIAFLNDNLSREELQNLNILMNNSSYIYSELNQWDDSELSERIDWLDISDVERDLKKIEISKRILVIDDFSESGIAFFDDDNQLKTRYENILKEKYSKPIVSENGLIKIYSPR